MMSRKLYRLALFVLSAWLTTGCWVFGFGMARAIPLGPGGPPPPTPAIPQVRLEHAGQYAVSLRSDYQWQSGVGSMVGTSGSGTGTAPLRLPAGASLNIVVQYPTPPAAVWVAELDAAGAPVHSAALDPASGVTAYTPASQGRFQLQVTAEWTIDQRVTHLFELEVVP